MYFDVQDTFDEETAMELQGSGWDMGFAFNDGNPARLV
jgi:hypothetical protein